MESPSATPGPCSSCGRIFQSRLFIVNLVAGSPQSRRASLSIVDSNVFNLVSLVSIWMGVLYCSRMLKCWSCDLLKVSERSLLDEANLLEFALSLSKWSASGEVRLKARKSALACGEDRSSCWSPKSKSESSTSLADSVVRNSSHPWSVLFFCRRRLSGSSPMLPDKFKFFCSEGLSGSRWCSQCGLRRVRWRSFK